MKKIMLLSLLLVGAVFLHALPSTQPELRILPSAGWVKVVNPTLTQLWIELEDGTAYYKQGATEPTATGSKFVLKKIVSPIIGNDIWVKASGNAAVFSVTRE